MDVRGSDTQEATGWGATPIILASVLAAVLFASIVGSLSMRKRAKVMAADLETAMAELGVQQGRAVSLQQELNRRDAFIDRNVIQGPDVYSAAPPIRSRDPVPEEVHSDPFAVGSDEESSDEESSDEESSDEESSEDESDDSDRSDDDESAESRTTVTPDCQLPKDDLWHEVKMEESPEDQSSWSLPQRDDSQAQVGSYWGEDTAELLPQGVAPSLVAGEGPAEVETTTTEVDRAKVCDKDVGAVPAPIVSSGSGSPPGGPDTPESFMSPPVIEACHYPLPW
ncbi:hypothetical protein C8A01DRAFT_21540 [Parachaetomium inaequale]|uniref:Uncharacterized protein n=1 Tax=Parachaetomium inaequale TaxID=2588326 RepID=A0AAN6P3V2_9PEZI|nr:hypothetical protein C8A01DRAFT_21540 [Parachaetomium inaequale]